jgi:hypothetical protein
VRCQRSVCSCVHLWLPVGVLRASLGDHTAVRENESWQLLQVGSTAPVGQKTLPLKTVQLKLVRSLRGASDLRLPGFCWFQHGPPGVLGVRQSFPGRAFHCLQTSTETGLCGWLRQSPNRTHSTLSLLTYYSKHGGHTPRCPYRSHGGARASK